MALAESWANERAHCSIVYNAALFVVQQSSRSDRLQAAEALLERMRADGCAISGHSLQLFFGASKGVPTAEPLSLLMAQMRRGVQPFLSVFNAMLAASLPPCATQEEGAFAMPLVEPPRPPILLQARMHGMSRLFTPAVATFITHPEAATPKLEMASQPRARGVARPHH